MRIKSRELGKFIKQHRETMGLSQNELHLKLGWESKNGQYISNIERGHCQLPVKQIKITAAVLGVTAQEIINLMVEDYKQVIFEEIFKEVINESRNNDNSASQLL